jgi:hypothetical protein
MGTEFVAIVSVIIAVTALLLTLWQNILTRRAVQSQVLLSIRELAQDSNYNEGMPVITNLKNYDNYDEFVASESKETQKLILDTVSFLNFGAHLVEEKLLPRQSLWNSYFWAYRMSSEKLLTWWLEGQRKNFPRKFSTFERMCRKIASVTEQAIMEYDIKTYRKL